jgi:hypothetical protein
MIKLPFHFKLLGLIIFIVVCIVIIFITYKIRSKDNKYLQYIKIINRFEVKKENENYYLTFYNDKKKEKEKINISFDKYNYINNNILNLPPIDKNKIIIWLPKSDSNPNTYDYSKLLSDNDYKKEVDYKYYIIISSILYFIASILTIYFWYIYFYKK